MAEADQSAAIVISGQLALTKKARQRELDRTESKLRTEIDIAQLVCRRALAYGFGTIFGCGGGT